MVPYIKLHSMTFQKAVTFNFTKVCTVILILVWYLCLVCKLWSCFENGNVYREPSDGWTTNTNKTANYTAKITQAHGPAL